MCNIPEWGLWSHETSVHYDAPCPLQFQFHCSAAQQALQALLWIAPRWRVLPCQGELCGYRNTWEMQAVDFQQVNKWPQHRGVLVANLAFKKTQYTWKSIISLRNTRCIWWDTWNVSSVRVNVHIAHVGLFGLFDKVLTPSQSESKPKLSYEGVTVLTSQER